MFAIFILTNGTWVQHGDVLTSSAADQSFATSEIAYLTKVLGVTAALFRKV